MLWPRSLLIHDRITLGCVGWPRYSLPNWLRDTHLYCIGASGSGKSKFLESLIVGDIRAGRGCALVDPHGDLARDVLAHLLSDGFFAKQESYSRLIYFDPARTDWTKPFNVLKTRLAPYTVANQVIETFRRTWPQSLREAPRFVNITTAALIALIEADCTLVDMATGDQSPCALRKTRTADKK